MRVSEGFGSRSINPSFSFSSPFCLGGKGGGDFVGLKVSFLHVLG